MNRFMIICLMMLISHSIPIQAWSNWADNQQCHAQIVTPKNQRELIAIIQKASQEKGTVHAVGSGHSWSDIVCAPDYLINTDKLAKILSVDRKTNRVTVQAGIKIKTLNAKLARLGLCLSNQAAITEQSIAGIIATATHGSGKTGTFASFITEVQLICADGSIKTISRNKNADLFPAVRTNIGSLGIIIAVTIQCEPLFKVEQKRAASDWQSMLSNYKKWIEENDFVQWYWSASDDQIEIVATNRIEDATTKKRNRRNANNGYSYQVLSGQVGAMYMEEEIAIPIEQFIDAALVARELVLNERKKNNLFSGILFRFVQAEQHNVLSPASNQDVLFFSITTGATSGYESFYKQFYSSMLRFNGRPHWGKINYLNQKDTKKLYGAGFDQFIAIRKKLDPDGMFSNSFTKKIFGW